MAMPTAETLSRQYHSVYSRVTEGLRNNAVILDPGAMEKLKAMTREVGGAEFLEKFTELNDIDLIVTPPQYANYQRVEILLKEAFTSNLIAHRNVLATKAEKKFFDTLTQGFNAYLCRFKELYREARFPQGSAACETLDGARQRENRRKGKRRAKRKRVRQ